MWSLSDRSGKSLIDGGPYDYTENGSAGENTYFLVVVEECIPSDCVTFSIQPTPDALSPGFDGAFRDRCTGATRGEIEYDVLLDGTAMVVQEDDYNSPYCPLEYCSLEDCWCAQSKTFDVCALTPEMECEVGSLPFRLEFSLWFLHSEEDEISWILGRGCDTFSDDVILEGGLDKVHFLCNDIPSDPDSCMELVEQTCVPEGECVVFQMIFVAGSAAFGTSYDFALFLNDEMITSFYRCGPYVEGQEVVQVGDSCDCPTATPTPISSELPWTLTPTGLPTPRETEIFLPPPTELPTFRLTERLTSIPTDVPTLRETEACEVGSLPFRLEFSLWYLDSEEEGEISWILGRGCDTFSDDVILEGGVDEVHVLCNDLPSEAVSCMELVEKTSVPEGECFAFQMTFVAGSAGDETSFDFALFLNDEMITSGYRCGPYFEGQEVVQVGDSCDCPTATPTPISSEIPWTLTPTGPPSTLR
jgi:hypothetical protein